MFFKLNWLTFSERVKYRKTTLVFKCVNRMSPMYMTNLFTPLTHMRETRQSTHYGTDDSFRKKELLRHEFCCEWCKHVERLASTMGSRHFLYNRWRHSATQIFMLISSNFNLQWFRPEKASAVLGVCVTCIVGACGSVSVYLQHCDSLCCHLSFCKSVYKTKR